MKVLLVYPRADRDISDWADHGALAEPLALEYLATVARADGHDVRVLDLRMHFDELGPTLDDYAPDVVGVTGYSMHVRRCLEICRKAKEHRPSCTTVVGGHHATLEPIDFQVREVDYIVRGEGTGPFRRILAECSGAADRALIPGVIVRDGTEFLDGGEQSIFKIDDIPWPTRDLAPADRPEYNMDWMKPIALARTSVGCPYRCSFCALWRITEGRYYTRNVELVAEEIAQLSESSVLLVDDEAFVNEKRMSALATALEKRKVEKSYFAYCRLDSLEREQDLMKQWRDVGLSRLMIGVETVFDWELKLYNKRQSHDSIVRGLEVARKLGFRLLTNFVVHPNYDDREFEGLIKFIRSHDLDYPSFTVWTPIPSTVDYNVIELTEKQENGRPNWDYFDLNHAVIPTKLPKAEFDQRFENLYWMFASKYGDAAAPTKKNITVSRKDRDKYSAALNWAYADLAKRVLSMSTKPAASAGTAPAAAPTLDPTSNDR